MLRVNPQRCFCIAGRKAFHQRGFFTLPKISPFSSSDEPPATQTYHERKIFPYVFSNSDSHSSGTDAAAHHSSYRRRDLYNLVADVSSYPSFVPYCTGSRILEKRVDQDGVVTMDAELMVGFFAFKESYVSRVTCRPYESVQVSFSHSLAGVRSGSPFLEL
jgi:coenzyme Q-binding protein COQ10